MGKLNPLPSCRVIYTIQPGKPLYCLLHPWGLQWTPGLAETLQRHCTCGIGTEMHSFAWGFLIRHQQQEAPSAGATLVHGLVVAVTSLLGHFFCAFNVCVRTGWSGLPLAQTFAKSTFLNHDFIVARTYKPCAYG